MRLTATGLSTDMRPALALAARRGILASILHIIWPTNAAAVWCFQGFANQFLRDVGAPAFAFRFTFSTAFGARLALA